MSVDHPAYAIVGATGGIGSELWAKNKTLTAEIAEYAENRNHQF